MKPLRDFVLIEKVAKEKVVDGIILPEGSNTGDLCSGVVTDIGPKIDPNEDRITVGSKVFFLREGTLSKDSKESIIHISKVLAVDDESHMESDGPTAIQVLDWKDFKTPGYDEFWKELTNFRQFSFHLKYLKPFVKIAAFQRDIYEALTQCVATPLIGSTATVQLVADTDKDKLAFVVSDDVFGGALALDTDDLTLQFEKDDLQAIIRKLPHYMRALGAIAATPAFARVFGKTFNRVTVATFRMKQIVRLVGKGRHGTTPTNNREIMQKVVNLGKAYKSKGSPFDLLSPITDSAGRINLKVSFERQIDSHQYTVWVNLEAPMNEDSTYLWTDLEIQDHSPGNITQRNYTPILTEFLRDCYFETFLKDLFSDVYCTTLGSK